MSKLGRFRPDAAELGRPHRDDYPVFSPGPNSYSILQRLRSVCPEASVAEQNIRASLDYFVAAPASVPGSNLWPEAQKIYHIAWPPHTTSRGRWCATCPWLLLRLGAARGGGGLRGRTVWSRAGVPAKRPNLAMHSEARTHTHTQGAKAHNGNA